MQNTNTSISTIKPMVKDDVSTILRFQFTIFSELFDLDNSYLFPIYRAYKRTAFILSP